MENKDRHFIAFDLGATSGRTILGTLSATGSLSTKELTRFPNHMLELNGHLYWNIYSLYENLIEGLRAAVKSGVKVESIGIDTWGVDVAYIAPDGKIYGIPNAYRDKDYNGASRTFFNNVMSASALYRLTGIQHMDFNTVFQLYQHRNDLFQKTAESIMFMPDALTYMLTGTRHTEYTIASTGGILDPVSHKVIPAIVEKCGVSACRFPEMVEPGTTVGTLSGDVAALAGCDRLNVIAVAEHDTASAVAAIPACDENFAYLSSGTWSLMGIESKSPVINDLTERENITNEGGVFGTIRVLKNITGMWIIEECLRKWRAEGVSYSYPDMVKMAEAAPAFKSMIDPDHPSFTAPKSMPEAIDSYCKATGQDIPANHGEYIRIVFESLALKYRKTLDIFRSVSEKPINKLHVIGGGSRNALLNQFTANAINIPVIAGPAEASALGNILMQVGCGSLQQLRNIVANSVSTITFCPESQNDWEKAYARFLKIIL